MTETETEHPAAEQPEPPAEAIPEPAQTIAPDGYTYTPASDTLIISVGPGNLPRPTGWDRLDAPDGKWELEHPTPPTITSPPTPQTIEDLRTELYQHVTQRIDAAHLVVKTQTDSEISKALLRMREMVHDEFARRTPATFFGRHWMKMAIGVTGLTGFFLALAGGMIFIHQNDTAAIVSAHDRAIDSLHERVQQVTCRCPLCSG